MFQSTNRILIKSLMAVAILGAIGDRTNAQVQLSLPFSLQLKHLSPL